MSDIEVPCRAPMELRALAAKARPDWKPGALDDALVDAHYKGLSWRTVLERIGSLMADPNAEPCDLTAAEYRQRPPGVDPNPEFRAARAAIHNARPVTPAMPDSTKGDR
ncbi:hypothetical protein [Actinomadura rudentiformis]|uniref:Uncharacterized protein n=1 Tax=Actinomadura rudentiformis TaxID=359158 RepID=A0A6H9YPR9_9ACTN|nr:hypothetical protein [Actinomadura rudentiformis]KAB2344831.1 hypothetical protein F8566_30025 [Actinomadura rudentiformis]